MTEQFGRILIIIGGVILISGIFVVFFGRFVKLDEIPGTIKIESGNLRIFIPILTSVIISIVLTVIMNIIVRLINR